MPQSGPEIDHHRLGFGFDRSPTLAEASLLIEIGEQRLKTVDGEDRGGSTSRLSGNWKSGAGPETSAKVMKGVSVSVGFGEDVIPDKTCDSLGRRAVAA